MQLHTSTANPDTRTRSGRTMALPEPPMQRAQWQILAVSPRPGSLEKRPEWATLRKKKKTERSVNHRPLDVLSAFSGYAILVPKVRCRTENVVQEPLVGSDTIGLSSIKG